MEKIDLIFGYTPGQAKDSPDISKMFGLKVDERTMFYFKSEEKKNKFIKTYLGNNKHVNQIINLKTKKR